MIHPLVDEDAWCYWVISIGALLSFVGLIAACICSCRRNENKNEFLGLAGMVTLKHSENESFNGLPALDVPQILTQDAVDCGKRATSANRSLPDIPKDRCPERGNELETESQDIYESTEPTGDQSELYATVQDKAEWNAVGDDAREDRGENSTRQTAINQSKDVHYQYARYPPNKSSNEEHPYAQLKNVEKVDVNQPRDRNNSGQTTDTEKPSTSSNNQTTVNPVAPPRARRSSSHNSLLVMESVCGIQAANAITGGVQANQDLPYMTPPLLAPTFSYTGQPQHNNSPLQHFSGDSQDSKGYTSISVREPLANIIAQTKAVSQQHQTIRPLVDSHYTTVSDDSDEMYAAIDEQDKLYTSGSDTYAQIQPAVTELQRPVPSEHVPVHSQPSLRPEEAHYAAPQPPSVDSLRHVAHAHSRQASSSSATSSIINPGSPKPEKRQANSPLPPPPPPPPPPPTSDQSSTGSYDGVTEVYAFVEKKGKAEDRGKCGKSLEDMYAKVMKKKKEETHTENPVAASQSHLHNSDVYKNNVDNGRISWSSHESATEAKREQEHVPNSPGVFDGNLEVPFETASVLRESKKRDSGNFDHGYEAVNNSKESAPDPDYETLRPQHASSTAKKLERNSGDFVIATELVTQVIYSSVSLKHRQVSNASSDDPGYEKVRLTCRTLELENDTDSEPNYESMPHDVCEPNYASVCRPGDSDTDPNYESVGHSDPNYESVKYMSLARKDEPPYEQVNSRAAALVLVDDYERVNRARSVSGYEMIRAEVRAEEQKSGGETDDEQYVQRSFRARVSNSSVNSAGAAENFRGWTSPSY